MKRALFTGFALVALAACGGARPNESRTAAWQASTPAHPQPTTFGGAMIDGARAMWAAATKADVDPRWLCADPKTDLRATPMSVGTQLAPLGPSPDVVYAAVVVTFSSPAGSFSPDDVIDTPGAKSATVFFQARALVAPDGHTSWMEANPPDPDHPRPWAYVAALEEPNEDRAALGEVVPPIRGGLEALVHAASSGACDVPVAQPDDLDRLPYQIDAAAREIYAARADTLKRALPRFCATVAKASGPWAVHVSLVEAGFKSGSNVATLRAHASIGGGAPCLGPVEVVRVGSEQ